MSIVMNLSILSLDKGQDFGLYGKSINSQGEEFDWMIGCDGHGSNQIINLLRSLNWPLLMEKENSLEEVLKIIDRCGTQYSSTGSTYMEVKVFKDRIESCSVGDSKIMIFMDNKLCYESTEHNLFNSSERERLQSRLDDLSITVQDVTTIPYVLTPKNITTTTKHYYTFSNTYMLAMSQALGHNNVTGIVPEKKTIHYSSDNKIRIILMSDGLSDMICSPSELEFYEKDMNSLINLECHELALIAEERWRQQWNYFSKSGEEQYGPYCFATPSASRSGFDDVLVVTCDIIPNIKVQDIPKEEVLKDEIQQEDELKSLVEFPYDDDDGDEVEC